MTLFNRTFNYLADEHKQPSRSTLCTFYIAMYFVGGFSTVMNWLFFAPLFICTLLTLPSYKQRRWKNFGFAVTAILLLMPLLVILEFSFSFFDSYGSISEQLSKIMLLVLLAGLFVITAVKSLGYIYKQHCLV